MALDPLIALGHSEPPSFTRSDWIEIIAEAIRLAGCEHCSEVKVAYPSEFHHCRKVGRVLLTGKACGGECRCTCGRAKIAKSP